jgi:hypothetical protein
MLLRKVGKVIEERIIKSVQLRIIFLYFPQISICVLYEAASELYGRSDRRLSAKLLPTLANTRCYAVSVTDPLRPYSRLSRPESLLFLPSSSSVVLTRLSAPPVPDPLLLRKSGSAGNRTRTSGPVARNSDH